MHILLLLIVLFYCSCTTGKMMTHEAYYNIQRGTSIADVQNEYGRPYEVKNLKRIEEYIYIERIQIGKNRELFRKYVFTVSDGRVVKKRTEEVESNTLHLAE